MKFKSLFFSLLLLILGSVQLLSQCTWAYNPFTRRMDCSSPAIASGDVIGPVSNTHGNIPRWNGTDSKTLDNGLGVSTAIATPGVDTKVPTEKAVRDALSTAVATTPFNLVGTADERHASIKRVAGQTANLFCFLDENNNNLFCFDKDGNPTGYGTGGGEFEFKHQTGTLAAGSESGYTNIGVNPSGVMVFRTYGGAEKTVATTDDVSANSKIGAFGCSWGEKGGTTLSANAKCDTRIASAGTITGWSVIVDAGTATVDVWKSANGAGIPTISNALTGAGATHPSVSSGTDAYSTDLTGWSSLVVTAKDIGGFNLDAVSGAAYVQIMVFYAKN